MRADATLRQARSHRTVCPRATARTCPARPVGCGVVEVVVVAAVAAAAAAAAGVVEVVEVVDAAGRSWWTFVFEGMGCGVWCGVG